jgi:hypothetical protein
LDGRNAILNIKISYKMSFLKIFFRKEQIITARHKKLRPGTNSYGQAHIVTACGVPLRAQGVLNVNTRNE